MLGELYIVATPIGNLKDITLRALEVLRDVDVVACEDTRHTLKLLSHYEIKKHLVSVHARNEKIAYNKVLELLAEGKKVAYVSDAGTPSVSDPGAILVNEARKEGFKVIPIPGCSAFVALLSVSGVFDKSIVFEGFLSPKPGRRKKRLMELMDSDFAVMLYESPYRIVKLLKDILEIDNSRHVIIGKELTKIHENVITGKVGEVLEMFSLVENVKGEFSLLISAKT
ncbi:MAG: 16S rRNA (cytidine(1402)-2'-O)-methyltransferase [Treponema sp.]